MKIGAENKKQLIVMAVLLVILAAIMAYEFGGTGTSSAAPPVATTTVPAPSSPQRGRKLADPSATQNDLDPTLRLDVLESSRKVKYEPGRNIFTMEAPKIEPPIASVRPTPALYPPTPTPTPPPPPIPLKFYGFANKPGEARKIFLAEGEGQNSVVFIAKQGDIVDRRFKVLQISATSVQIEDVLYNNKQNIALTAR